MREHTVRGYELRACFSGTVSLPRQGYPLATKDVRMSVIFTVNKKTDRWIVSRRIDDVLVYISSSLVRPGSHP